MMNKLFLSTALAVATLGVSAIAQSAQAGVIVQPTSASSSGIGFGSLPLSNSINQSGLSSGYVNGITDFDTYIAGNPTHSGFGNVAQSFFNQTTGVLTYDLGSVLTTARLAYWAGVTANENISSFELFSDDDGNFGNGGTTSLGTFNPSTAIDGSVQVIDFTDATSQFIHLNILANNGAVFTQIGEVAFDQGVAPSATTPEPSTIVALAMVGSGLLLNKRVKRG
ncbi:PEP-CTERM sorting domain-containing protein [Crocosphaera sp. UHCC 0190]|uniref:PEP-CTERM sorting domain-containing protein n=1 Tax=Crocosphaera sp. UHCC 0190 TaxID=3110246 RepID=UPI002B210C69|nr:PEP-CTERM sorting domain-containing protein [Crocosphaera sp. UHCC 0190]MEA5508413.1 PEP-CTERM sorting domain-containing protein [Crocosphaera sp. UHCC 0190]